MTTGQQIIDTAKGLLKLTATNEFDGDFYIWLRLGYQKLYNIKTYPRQDIYLPMSNGSCAKPKGFYEFIGCALNTDTAKVYYVDKYFSAKTASEPITVNYYNWLNTVQEQNGRFYFGSLAADATLCHMWYKGFPTTEDGCDLAFDEAEEEPLSYFLAFKFSEFGNGLDYEKKAAYFGSMFDTTSKILRGQLTAKDARERNYEKTSTAIALLNHFPY